MRGGVEQVVLGGAQKARRSETTNYLGKVRMPLEQQKPPDLSARQHANKLIRLIRKLRWMGMEEEAERVQTELTKSGAQPTDSVLVASRETD